MLFMILKEPHLHNVNKMRKKFSLDKPEPQGRNLLCVAQLWQPALWTSQYEVDTYARRHAQNFWEGKS